MLCLSHHLAAFLFPQLCPSKFAMPSDLCPYPLRRFTGSVFPHISAALSSLFLHWRFCSRRDRARHGLPVQSLRNVSVCLTSGPFFASTPLTVPSLLAFPYLPCHSFLPHSHLFLGFLSCCVPLWVTVLCILPSICQLLPILPFIAPFPYPVRPCSFQRSLTAELLLWKGHQRPISVFFFAAIPLKWSQFLVNHPTQCRAKWDFYDTVRDLNYSDFHEHGQNLKSV